LSSFPEVESWKDLVYRDEAARKQRNTRSFDAANQYIKTNKLEKQLDNYI